MINCFPDLEELCWHIKGLWYIARCRHSLWFVRCILLGLHYQVNWKQNTSLKKTVGKKVLVDSLPLSLWYCWPKNEQGGIFKIWDFFSFFFFSLHTFHSGTNGYDPSCFAHYFLFSRVHWDSNTWQQGLRDFRTKILLVWNEGHASLL